MREVNVDKVTENIKEMCIEANHFLTDDMKKVFKNAVVSEESPLGKQVLNQLNENLDIAANDMIPICQDTGMAVVFINVGQDVHFTNGNITAVVLEEQEFAESKKAAGESQQEPPAGSVGNGFMNIPEGIDEELPFN